MTDLPRKETLEKLLQYLEELGKEPTSHFIYSHYEGPFSICCRRGEPVDVITSSNTYTTRLNGKYVRLHRENRASGGDNDDLAPCFSSNLQFSVSSQRYGGQQPKLYFSTPGGVFFGGVDDVRHKLANRLTEKLEEFYKKLTNNKAKMKKE